MPSKFEKKAKVELEADGWLVDTKWGMNRFSLNNDYWHIFDLLAYQGKIIRGIAIKGQGGVPKELREKITAFKTCEHFVKELWAYHQPTHKGIRKKNAPYIIRKEIID
jgi:hypothetical protein